MNHVEKLLWWLITAKRGGINRARIIEELHNQPYNANQLATELNLDYKTIQHHLKILHENNIIYTLDDSYGKLYFLTDKMEENYPVFEEIISKIKKK
ncbi:MAG: winged helix-turn-helix domain-containing protein [Methanobacteriaceae archaeon]|nr:winged helix-turn-helix domain-containing protein [Methanobacteriaceae archaeon]